MRFYIPTMGVLCRKVVQIDVNKTIPLRIPRTSYDHNKSNNNENGLMHWGQINVEQKNT